MSARPDLHLVPRWPFSEPNTTVMLDYSPTVPGVMSYLDITETDLATGEVRRITAKPSQVIPGGISLAYPSQNLLYAHLVRMGFQRTQEPEPTQVERPVFGRISERDGRKLAKQAAHNGQGSLL